MKKYNEKEINLMADSHDFWN